jgi:hypothetical protein
MSKQVPHNERDPLGECLRREDLEARPAFSEALHERIVRAMAARDANPAVTLRRPTAIARQPYFRWAAAAAVAGFLLIAIGVSWWWLAGSSPSDRGNVEVAEAVPSDKAGPGSAEEGEADAASDGLPVELVVIRRLTAKAAARLDLWNQLAMLEPSPKNLFYDDVCRAANAMLARVPEDSTPSDE